MPNAQEEQGSPQPQARYHRIIAISIARPILHHLPKVCSEQKPCMLLRLTSHKEDLSLRLVSKLDTVPINL